MKPWFSSPDLVYCHVNEAYQDEYGCLWLCYDIISDWFHLEEFKDNIIRLHLYKKEPHKNSKKFFFIKGNDHVTWSIYQNPEKLSDNEYDESYGSLFLEPDRRLFEKIKYNKPIPLWLEIEIREEI